MYKDVESLNYYNILKGEGKSEDEILKILGEKSRDNSRTPMQWDDSVNGGFSTGTPWLSTIKNYNEINSVKSLEDEDSVFYHYKKLISLRREFDVISEGSYETFLENDKKIFAFKRTLKGEELLVVNNFYLEEKQVNIEKLGDYKVLLSNYSNTSKKDDTLNLREYESVVLYRN